MPTLGKVETEKNGNFYPKKMEFFLSMEAPTGQRPTIYDIFRVTYHYTTLSLVSGFRFSSQYIIRNRV